MQLRQQASVTKILLFCSFKNIEQFFRQKKSKNKTQKVNHFGCVNLLIL